MNRGVATFTLDSGHCPPWLFARMVKLGRAMAEVIIDEFGPDEFVGRLADPVWFQSLGTVLAFDWNASGLTTILTAALKEALRGREAELGVFICGGKGKTSFKTPAEIKNWQQQLSLSTLQAQKLEYNSRMSAKVDGSLLQDGYQIYHHSFMFTKNGAWTVVQQGMNQTSRSARRYHWNSSTSTDLIVEPHSGIATQMPVGAVLNLSAQDSRASRHLALELLGNGYRRLSSDLQVLDRRIQPYSRVLRTQSEGQQLTWLELGRGEFKHHPVEAEEFARSPYLQKILQQLSEYPPDNYEKLVATPGVGPKTIRALALVGEVLYGAVPSYQDPARYSFAHGGKDATPYPVDKPAYDQTIQVLVELVRKSRLDYRTKSASLQRLCGPGS